MPRAAARASRRAAAASAKGQGRRWTMWPQRAAGTRRCPLGLELATEERDAKPVDPRPEVGKQRRKQCDRGRHHHQDGERAGNATPYMYGSPVSASLKTAITTVKPAMITLRPAVVTASTTASWR